MRTAWDRFDAWLPFAAAAALAVTALAQAIRRWQFRPSRVRPGGPLALLALMNDAGAETLFDRRTDPQERINILPTEPALAEPLRAALARWHEASAPLAARLGPRGGGVLPSEETARRLRALGYVE